MKGDSSTSRRRFLAKAGALTSVAVTGCLQTSTEEEPPESITYTDEEGDDTEQTSTESSTGGKTEDGIPYRMQSPVPYNGLYLTEKLEIGISKPEFYGTFYYGEDNRYAETSEENHWFPGFTVLVANRAEDEVVAAPRRSEFVLVSGNSQYEPHTNAMLTETEYEGGQIQPGVEISGSLTFEQTPDRVTRENAELVWSPMRGDRVVWKLTDESPDLGITGNESSSGDGGGGSGISVNIDE